MPTTFEPSELNGSLAKLALAESIGDPLKRCFAYPDPPGSHWPRAVVTAYCRYRNQKVVSIAEVKNLIESGHADTLDRKMAKALRLQRIYPGSRGLLDWTFQSDFSAESSDVRRTLDTWKKQSPRSAYAYAASGYSYAYAAYKARGDKWTSETQASQIAAMRDLLVKARGDLDKAITAAAATR